MVFPRVRSIFHFLQPKLPATVCEHFVAIQVNVPAINISYQSTSPVLRSPLLVLPDTNECFCRSTEHISAADEIGDFIIMLVKFAEKKEKKNDLSKMFSQTELMFNLKDRELKGNLCDINSRDAV